MARAPIFSILAAAALAGACAHQSEVATTTETGDASVVVNPGAAPLPSWETIVSNVGETTVRGEVAVRATAEGGTYAEISIEGAEAGDRHPWHIHTGDCGSGGGIVGNPTGYLPLIVDADGDAQAVATLGAVLDVEGDYHVNVHESTARMDTIVACGDL